MAAEYPSSPRIAVGGVLIHQGRVLLVERAKPPAEDEWAIPGGSVELGETLAAALEREMLEETGLRVRARELCYSFETVVRDDDGRVRFHYVILDYLVDYVAGEPAAGDDVRAVRFFAADELGRVRLNSVTRHLLTEVIRFASVGVPPRR